MNAADRLPPPILHVVRLKAGETRTFELALPLEDFLPHGRKGRHYLRVLRIPGAESLPVNGNGECDLGDGLTLVWEAEQNAVSFRATQDIKPISTDLRLVYGGFTIEGEHTTGFRVVAEAAVSR